MNQQESPKLIIDVPSDVFEFIQNVKAEDPTTAQSIQKMVVLAKKEGLKNVALWIKDNPIAYGVGYWNGFNPIVDPDPDDKPPTKRKRKRTRIPKE